LFIADGETRTEDASMNRDDIRTTNRDDIRTTPAGSAKKPAVTATGDGAVFVTLKEEHAAVNELMTRLARTRADDVGQSERRRELFEKIRTDLLTHASAEETTFYARLKSRPETSSLIDESIGEHQSMEDLIEELTRLGTDSLIFDSRFQELVANVRHHVDEEENRLFPRAKDVLTSEEIEDLDEAFRTQKAAQLRAFGSGTAPAHH
jgi:hemerythrin superfamily protein